jgi:8-oxo-dGTP pyrophosphatase MutT (NUDIX family)
MSSAPPPGAASGGGADAEHYNPGPPTRPRQAAAVILLRDAPRGPEVLLVKRTPHARFMGGVWVFPGGALAPRDPAPAGGAPRSERSGLDAHRATAARELQEEAGVRLPPGEPLVELARWITPPQVSIRFDTRFFLARLPDGQTPAPDGGECVDLGWFTPRAALDAHAGGTIALVFPTIKQLEQLEALADRHGSTDALIAAARDLEVHPVEPHVVLGDGHANIVMPGEPGYD